MTSAFFLQCTTYTDVPLSAYVIVTKPAMIVSTRRWSRAKREKKMRETKGQSEASQFTEWRNYKVNQSLRRIEFFLLRICLRK